MCCFKVHAWTSRASLHVWSAVAGDIRAEHAGGAPTWDARGFFFLWSARARRAVHFLNAHVTTEVSRSVHTPLPEVTMLNAKRRPEGYKCTSLRHWDEFGSDAAILDELGLEPIAQH